MISYAYKQHGQQHQRLYTALFAAYGMAYAHVYHAQAWPIALLDEAGNVIMGRDSIFAGMRAEMGAEHSQFLDAKILESSAHDRAPAQPNEASR